MKKLAVNKNFLFPYLYDETQEIAKSFDAACTPDFFLYNDEKKLDVILTEENLSKAIGRRGQNVRLATKLLNYEINIMTDQEDSEKR